MIAATTQIPSGRSASEAPDFRADPVFLNGSRFPLFLYLQLLFLLGMQSGAAQSVSLSEAGCDPADATSCLQRLLRSTADTVIIDRAAGVWQVGPLRFDGLRDKTLMLQPGVTLAALPGAFPKSTDALLEFRNCSNLDISGAGAVLRMNKEEYTGGEWRHLISLRKCDGVRITGLELRDSGGDGIYIAGIGKGSYSSSIYIEGVRSVNNRRQGMSLISVSGLEVVNSSFEETKGTLPETGLDLEPNSPQDRLEDICFRNCRFLGNNHAGILLALHNMNSGSRPIDVTFVNCLLSENHQDPGNHKAAEIYVSANTTDPVKGNVRFQDCLIENSDWGVLFSRKRADAFRLEFADCAARNICRNGKYPPFALEVTHYEKPSFLGGIDFGDFYLDYDVPGPVMKIRGSLKGGMSGLKDVKGRLLLDNPQAGGPEYINYLEGGNVNVDLEVQFVK